MRGWALDAKAPLTPAHFFIIVDGLQVAEVHCTGPRPDVAKAGLGTEMVGYEVTLPLELLDGENHRIELRDILRRSVTMLVGDRQFESYDFAYRWRPPIRSYIDGLRGGAFEGWVLQGAPGCERLVGDCTVKITCNDIPIGFARANRYRADVAKSLAADAFCGFQFIPPLWARKAHAQSFHFTLVPDGRELQNSPIVTSLVSDQNEALVRELSDTIDHLHVELTRVRRRMKDLLPRPLFNLGTYHFWYRDYAPLLRQRVLVGRDATAPQPLVSVICPVFKPDLAEFEAAITSVIEQTYPHWELLLVDDGSRDPALTSLMDRYAAADQRIRLLPQRRNAGISAATNAAVAKARGEWVAFFDHDDLLVDVALEVMLRAAQESGARLLYSDEDKIDKSGEFSDPAFKTAWNHRLLLEVNYVCHLLFVAAPLLAEVGPLNSKLNGAQDHDLILRLSERIPAQQIAHVPEILYHWRRSATSTAGDVSAKPYAIDAGVTAVAEHLKRTGKAARVSSRATTTSYRVEWEQTAEPTVTIIIPFKDEIATTRRCVRTILDGTAYRKYDIILVDNWSTSDQLDKFVKEMARTKRVKILRVEEEFNYSRLNNLAAAQSSAEFFMFMNNDLFVSGESWLRTLVNEALADETVGIVGGKFVFPNRTVQHAGVILGVGSVACHMGTGLAETDPGYCRRLEFAQEYSAVTAAGMLIRASVFKAVGGFDEAGLKVAFNDVDLCLKVGEAGYKIIWTPDFLAEHHESLSRGDDKRPVQENRFFHEMQTMIERWGDVLTTDPFYNPNLSMDRQAYFELLPPEAAAGRGSYVHKAGQRPGASNRTAQVGPKAGTKDMRDKVA
jgi:GT2 family glycosyltransferase